MSSSEISRMGQWRNSVNRFLATPYYIVVVTVLSILAHIFSLELLFYTLVTVVAIYTATLGADLLPLTPLFLFCYIVPGASNNPGRSETSIFFGKASAYILALAAIIVVVLMWYVVRNRKQFFRKRKLLIGLLVLSAAYLLSGIGSAGYGNGVVVKNLKFALMQAGALLVPYWLLSGGIRWENAPKDYFAWTGLAGGVAVLAEVANCYITQNAVVNGVIVREQIYTGWGMYNNMGVMLVIAVPMALYLAVKGRRGWLGIVTAVVLMIGVLLTCSRASLLTGILFFIVGMVLMLYYSEDRKRNIITLCSLTGIALVGLAVFWGPVMQLFSRFLRLGMSPSSRDVLFTEGLKLFTEAPVFGSSFYSPGYLPWDFATIEKLSNVIPPRWHNTVVQLLASCGIVGMAAYSFHRIQTLRLIFINRSKEKNFIACAIGVILVCSLLDCHFFNLGPTLFYSVGLAYAEHISKD